MFGNFGNTAGRIRQLSDSVDDLTKELRLDRQIYVAADKIAIGNGMRQPLDNIADAINALASELRQTNTHLSSLSKAPLIGMLGGSAEEALQRLVARSDALIAALQEAKNGVKY